MGLRFSVWGFEASGLRLRSVLAVSGLGFGWVGVQRICLDK